MIRPNSRLLVFCALGAMLSSHGLTSGVPKIDIKADPFLPQTERPKTAADLAAIAKAEERRRRKAERKAREQLASSKTPNN